MLLLAGVASAVLSHRLCQEYPYFVTYSQEMEEPGNLDIEMFNVVGNPQGGDSFMGSDVEFEYGLKGWWTTEFYLDGQATQNQSTIFTGFRWENRFRPLSREHWINPVLYAEFEDTSADKTIREVVGHDGRYDFLVPNWLAHMDKEREIELKLILGSNVHGWNISENFIAEKNLCGRSVGVRLCARGQPPAATCRQCARVRLLRGEVSGGRGNVWRPGRYRRIRVAPHFAISGPDHQLDCAEWNDGGVLAAVRAEWLQHSRAVSLLGVLRNPTVSQPLSSERAMTADRALAVAWQRFLSSRRRWRCSPHPTEPGWRMSRNEIANELILIATSRMRWRPAAGFSSTTVPTVTATTRREPRSGPP